MIGKNSQVNSLHSQLEQWDGGIMGLKETNLKAHILI
jgi:hypothetical protein